METQKTSNKGMLEGLIGFAFGTFITSIVALGIGKTLINNTIEGCAQRAAMTHYQPVGNGGALAVLYGRMSQGRIEMYKRMQRAYEEVAGKNNLSTLKYDALKFYAEGKGH